ncbi:MAG TPA: low molecular weight protein-tyrosine-phosphatase [Acidimicrobiales bacterium]|nr:low molecular weight protein-tyrosine-phosphatase [Acidimicrobiales bacterium]
MSDDGTRTDRYRICFVGCSDVCRSPMAVAVLSKLAAERGVGHLLEVDSAGTNGARAGESTDPGALYALAARGYDGTGHLARQFDPSWIAARDLVVALDRSGLRLLSIEAGEELATRVVPARQFDPASHGTLDVPDPYGGSHEEFDRSLDIIERSCAGILDHLDTSGGRAALTPPAGADARRR